MFKKEYLGRGLVTLCGIFIIALTLAISIFLLIKGTDVFRLFHHSVGEFMFSDKWAPMDVPGQGGGKIGARIYILGSLMTCGLALLIALPFSISAAIFISEI